MSGLVRQTLRSVHLRGCAGDRWCDCGGIAEAEDLDDGQTDLSRDLRGCECIHVLTCWHVTNSRYGVMLQYRLLPMWYNAQPYGWGKLIGRMRVMKNTRISCTARNVHTLALQNVYVRGMYKEYACPLPHECILVCAQMTDSPCMAACSPWPLSLDAGPCSCASSPVLQY